MLLIHSVIYSFIHCSGVQDVNNFFLELARMVDGMQDWEIIVSQEIAEFSAVWIVLASFEISIHQTSRILVGFKILQPIFGTLENFVGHRRPRGVC